MPGYPAAPPSKRRRGALIAVLVVAALLVLCGGGGAVAFLVTRNSDGQGQSTGTAAVNGFLTAVYKDRSAAKAAPFVCAVSRDKTKIGQKIDELNKADAQYDTPAYNWSPPQSESLTKDEQVLTTTVTLTTKNEQRATQKLRLLATHSTGWFVCEVQQVS